MVVMNIARKLTEKEKKFADYFIETGNASEAYKKAGYKDFKSSGVQGNKTLNKPKIKQYIDEKIQKKDNMRIATQDEVLIYLTSVMRGESLAEVVVIEGQGEGISEARRMNKSPDEKEKLKAAEMLAKRYGIDKPVEKELEDGEIIFEFKRS